jgi:succinate dehydrogenase/fumarate reductase iron-sulfur protein
MRNKQSAIQVTIRRFSEEVSLEPYFQTYEVPAAPGMSVMDVLRYIQEHLDATLGFDCSCRIGICKACALRVNGEVAMACSTVASDGIQIEPINDNQVRRDLIARPDKYPPTLAEVMADLPHPAVKEQ